MNLKKCLKTKKGWSFLEYTIIFAAVTVAVAGILQSTLTPNGRINNAFKAKAKIYTDRIRQ